MPESASPGIQAQEELKKVVGYVKNKEEQDQYNFILGRVSDARTQRDRVREEFDDLSFEDDYYLNKQALISYLRPKINDDEVRIVTGTTEKRIESVWNELIGMNLQPEVMAFDQNDNELQQVGETFTDIVRRTNEMEQDEERYVDAVMELLSQRAVFVEELWIDKKAGSKRIKRCEKRVLSGLQVFLGDISLPAWRFNDQPYIFKYERMTFTEGKQIFGDYPNWEHVAPGPYAAYTLGGDNIYRKNSLKKDEIDVLHYMSYPDDEYQILINGIPMETIGAKLPWRYEGYNISMTVLKPIAIDFAYGKPLTASAKTLQALDNETVRNLIFKMRQAIMPPIGVKSGKIYSRDIWNAGAQTQGISDKDYTKLIDHQGVTASEFQMLDLIKREISDMTGTSAIDLGSSRGGRQTATAIIQAKQQAIKMLGLSVISVMRLKRNMTFQRIYNVLEHYSKETRQIVDPISQQVRSVYAQFTINDAELSGGRQGRKMVQFSDTNMQDPYATHAKELRLADAGQHTEFKNVNIKLLASLKPTWYVTVVNQEKDNSELSKSMFQDKITQGNEVSQLTGRRISANKLTDSFERVWKEKDFFETEQPQSSAVPGQPQQGMQSGQPAQDQGGASNAAQGVKSGPTSLPSLGNLMAGQGGTV